MANTTGYRALQRIWLRKRSRCCSPPAVNRRHWPPRPTEALDQTSRHRIAAHQEHGRSRLRPGGNLTGMNLFTFARREACRVAARYAAPCRLPCALVNPKFSNAQVQVNAIASSSALLLADFRIGTSLLANGRRPNKLRAHRRTVCTSRESLMKLVGTWLGAQL